MSGRALRFAPLGLLAALTLASACSDPGGRPLGALCEEDGECASGLCLESLCLDPAGDEDVDGLTNGREGELGTDPRAADSDADGRPDASELGAGFAAVDSDGDGRHDALESVVADGDADCLPDQDDAVDDPPTDRGALCPKVGVCAAVAPTAACENGVHICDYGEVRGYEWSESLCDGLDNDCDGVTDERCALLAHYPFDGTGAELGRDASGHGHDGVVAGALPGWDRFGRYGGAIHFGARGDVVRVGAAADMWSTPVTITFWVRPAAGFDALGLFAASVGASADGVLTRRVSLESVSGASAEGSTGADRCLVEAGASGALTPPACLVSERWSFVALVRAGDTWSIFVNAHHIQTVVAPAAALPAVSEGFTLLIGRTVEGGAQFRGELDDLRVIAGPLAGAALGALFREGGWDEVGSHANPARGCDHVLAGGGSAGSARYWIDPDGDGLGAPFEAWCDMVGFGPSGGGWTLAWSYGFTAYEDFGGVRNAVTPTPAWPAPGADVAVSESAPRGPWEFASGKGAIPFAWWTLIGKDVAIRSNVNDLLVCEPERGSLVDGVAGAVRCTNLGGPGGGAGACSGVVPTELRWEPSGPVWATADGAFYAWDGATTVDWPVHDACGVGAANQTGGVAAPGGEVYLRHAARLGASQGRDCAEAGVLGGVAVIDPTAAPGPLPRDGAGRMLVTCSALERGGWTQLIGALLPTLGDGRLREYLVAVGGDEGRGWFRTPATRLGWSWQAYQDLPGVWIFEDAESGALGGYACAGSLAEESARRGWGLGCGELGAPETGFFDAVAGTTSWCDEAPGAFGGAQCVNDLHVWTRVVACEPDPGSLLGDGRFAQLLASSGPRAEAARGCWQIDVDDPAVSDLAADTNVAPPGGAPPSLHATGGGVFTLPSIAQIRQPHLTVVAGHHYQLRVTGRAATARPIWAELVDAAGNLTTVEVPLGEGWATASVAFEVPRTSIDAELRIQFGRASAADVWLAEVVLVLESR